MTLSTAAFDEDTPSDDDNAIIASVTQDEEPRETDDPAPPTTDDLKQWTALNIDNFVQELQTATSETAFHYHQGFPTAKEHIRISKLSTSIDNYSPLAIHRAIASVGIDWTATDEWQHVADEFDTMQLGRTKWLKLATDRLLRGDSAPNAYLLRSTQENHFQVVWGRGQILTPLDCDVQATDEERWMSYMGDGSRNHQPKVALFETGRGHEKMFVDKVKLISCDEVLRTTREKHGTIIATTVHDKFNGIPLMCPLPWTWAAIIMAYPTWTCQEVSRWIAQRMLAWPVNDDLPEVQRTMISVWKFLCASATAKGTNKPNAANFCAMGQPNMDAGMELFLRNHAGRYWWSDVEEANDEEDDEGPPQDATTEQTKPAGLPPKLEPQEVAVPQRQPSQPPTARREQPPRRASSGVPPPPAPTKGVLPPPTTETGVLPPPTIGRTTTIGKLPPKAIGVKRPPGEPPAPQTKRVRMSLGFESELNGTDTNESTTPATVPAPTTTTQAIPDISALLSHPNGLIQALGAMASVTLASQQRETTQ